MTIVGRLQQCTILLGIAACISCVVWGDADSERGRSRSLENTPPFSENLQAMVQATKFSDQPVLTYTKSDGSHLFALQVQPELAPVKPRPRDILIMVDTSASQAGKPYAMAQNIAEAVIKDASPLDRISLWTVNTPKATRDLSHGFQKPTSPEIATALETLRTHEYPSGATDLQHGLRQAIKAFVPRLSRQQVLLFLGDAESAYNPLKTKDRLEVSAELNRNLVAFYPVPLGPSIQTQTLNHLVTATGGSVVRVPAHLPAEKRVAALVKDFNSALEVPVLFPTKLNLPEGVEQSYPTKLPPLRADAPTLILGTFNAKPATLSGTIEGTVLGKAVTVNFQETVPSSELDNYFLVTMIDQWSQAKHPEAPALLRADRTLALAYEQCRLAKNDLLSQAHWAVQDNNLPVAKRLYQAAKVLDTTDVEAKLGLEVVDKLQQGVLTKQQLLEQAQDSGERVQIGKGKSQAETIRVALQEGFPPGQPSEPALGTNPDDLLQQEQARRSVLEQQTQLVVEETIERARQLLREGDPDGAQDLLKRQINSIRENPALRDELKQTLGTQMEVLLRDVVTRGALIKQQQATERERIARARERLAREDRRVALQERLRERIRAFRTLMNQARYEEAYREALIMQQEAISEGYNVPIETTASYIIGLTATNLREIRELKRLREERFLLTMLQVEKSHVPYPDEPPVHFPPATVWRELSLTRKGYDVAGLGEPEKPETLRLRNLLDAPFTNQQAVEGVPLSAALDLISQRVGATILIDEAAFEAANPGERILDKPVNLPVLNNVSLATALRLMLDPIGAVYQVRRDYIDIVPAKTAYTDKVLRVFPVADLVFPIPQAVNQQSLFQNLQLLGSSLTILGQGLLGFTGFNFVGNAGFGGGFNIAGVGGFGAAALGGGGIGGIAGFGGPGGLGAVGIAGGGLQGGNAGFGAGPFQGGGGQVNQGFGGGLTGFGGGQQGQFGNLGGQFGLQGGTTQDLLIALITQVVEPGFWDIQGAAGTLNANPDPLTDPAAEPSAPREQLNTIGFYPPANALVVRGFSRRYSPLERPTRRTDPGLPAGIPGLGALGQANPKLPGLPGQRLNGNPPRLAANVDVPQRDPVAIAQAAGPLEEKDPAKLWTKFIDERAEVTPDLPRMVIDAADLLARAEEMAHAGELIKAALREGVVTNPWVHDSLALALELSQANPEEIERANVSIIDVAPLSPEAYLQASKALADLNQHEQAIAFCQQATQLEPNLPDAYANALVYAGKADGVDTDAVAWAAGNLLGRDWAIDNATYHGDAKEQLRLLEKRLRQANRPGDLKRLQEIVDRERQRDLIVDLEWSGIADLDLEVLDPISTTCSVYAPQSQGGGVLHGDDLSQKRDHQSETYTAANAFSGTYQVKIRRIFGRTLGDKARLHVIKHQGTDHQSQEFHTLRFAGKDELIVNIQLGQGRRTDLATLPPLSSLLVNKEQPKDRSQLLINRIQMLSNPVTWDSPLAMSGGTGAIYEQRDALPGNRMSPLIDGVQERSRIAPLVGGAADLAGEARTVMTPNGPKVQVELKPIYQTVEVDARPKVPLDLIPGAE